MEKKFPGRIAYLVLGFLFLALGLIGIILPVLPTTPFAICAAFFFKRAHPPLYAWILTLPYIGAYIMEWEKHGMIRPKAKVMCVLLVVFTIGVNIYFADYPQFVDYLLIVFGGGILA